jgi:hypothetical protein
MDLSKKGQLGGGVVATIVAVTAAVLATVIGAIIVAEFFGGVNTSSYSAAAQTAVANVQAKSWTAFTLLGVLILVVVGAAMIGIVAMMAR